MKVCMLTGHAHPEIDHLAVNICLKPKDFADKTTNHFFYCHN
jgi:hypothetical protein